MFPLDFQRDELSKKSLREFEMSDILEVYIFILEGCTNTWPRLIIPSVLLKD